MTRRVKLKSKDAAALEEFLRSLRFALGKNLLEVGEKKGTGWFSALRKDDETAKRNA